MKLRYGVGAVAVFAALLAACSGGGSTGGGYTPSTPAPSPSTASKNVTMSTTSSSAVTLPTISNGSSATVTLPAASGGATATITLQGSVPSGAPQPQVVRAGRNGIGGGNVTPLDFIIVSVNQSVSIASTPAFSFTLGSPPPAGSSTYIAVLDLNNPTSGWHVVLGPGTVSGNTVSFAAQALAPPLTLQANDKYVFALVATSSVVTPPPPGIGPGTAASYTGTKTVNYAYGYDFDYPQPGPTATAPPVTLNYTVTASVSVGASPFPGTSSAQLVDEHVAETDAGSVSSSAYTTDSWVSAAAATSGYNELLYGQTVQEPSSSNLPVVTTLYNNAQIVDELPEVDKASWSNSPQSTIAYSYSSGDAGTRTVANDGSYNDVEQLGPINGGATSTLTENADGSGSITGPYFGGGIVDSVAFSAPSPAATPSIDVTISFSAFAQQYYGFPATQVIPDDVWYPYTAGQAPTLYHESDTVTAGVSLPASCSAAPYAKANDVQRTIVSLDTVIGDMDTTQMDSYDVDGFPVCLVTSDVLSYAYDEQGTTPYLLLIGTQLGLETVTTNETLVIQNLPQTTSTTMARTQKMVRARALVAALQGHVLNALARERAAHTRSFIQALKTTRDVHQALVHGGRL